MLSFFKTTYQNSRLSLPVSWPWWTAASVAVIIAMGWGHEVIWTGVVFFGFWCLIGLVGWTFLKLFQITHQLNHWAEQVAISSVTGLAFLLIIWLASFYIFKSSWPGTFTALALAGIGLVWVVGKKKTVIKGPDGLVYIILLLALGFGCYHNYGIELIKDGFVGFYGPYRGDVLFHTSTAALIQNQGLPTVNSIGSLLFPLKGATHIGSMVLLAGLSDLTTLNLFQCVRIINVTAYGLIALMALSLVFENKKSSGVLLIASLAPFFLASFSLPFDLISGNWYGVIRPLQKSLLHPNCPPASFIHNLTQLHTILFGFGALVVLKKHASGAQLRWITITSLLIGLTYIIKPSLSILAIPAFIMYLVLKRITLKEWLIVVCTLGVTVTIFYIPAFFPVTFPEMNAWALRWPDYEWKEYVSYLTYIGVGWFVVWKRLASIMLTIRKKGVIHVVDFVVIMIIGGIFFSLFFYEPTRAEHRNQFWGIASVAVLGAPFFVLYCLEWCNKNVVKNRLKKSGAFLLIIILSFQFLSGIFYNAGYPFYRSKKFHVNDRTALIELNRITKKNTKFLFDPDMGGAAMINAYLARQLLWDFSSIPHRKKKALAWEKVNDDYGDVRSYLDHYDAIALGFNTRWIKPQLIERQWVKCLDMREHREVWIKPSQLRMPLEKD